MIIIRSNERKITIAIRELVPTAKQGGNRTSRCEGDAHREVWIAANEIVGLAQPFLPLLLHRLGQFLKMLRIFDDFRDTLLGIHDGTVVAQRGLANSSARFFFARDGRRLTNERG